MEIFRKPTIFFHSMSGYLSFIDGEMRAQASPMISICLMVANRFSELERNSSTDTFIRYDSTSLIASNTCRTRSSSLSGGFIDQDLISFDVRLNVFGNAVTGNDIDFIV